MLLGAIMATCGCSTTKQHPIVEALAMKSRNSVWIALWTLEANGVLTSAERQNIDFELPYSEVRPQIQAIQERVRRLPDTELNSLDRSLAHHRSIYSPIFFLIGWDSSHEEDNRRYLQRLSNTGGAANGSQPTRSETNATSAAAASRR